MTSKSSWQFSHVLIKPLWGSFSSLSTPQFSCKGETVCFEFGIYRKRYYQQLKTGDVAPCPQICSRYDPMMSSEGDFFLKCINGGIPFAWTDMDFQSCFHLLIPFGCYEMGWKRRWNVESVLSDGLCIFLIFPLAFYFSVYSFVSQSSQMKRHSRRSSPGIKYLSRKQRPVS